MNIDNNNHSVFSLNYLLILTTHECKSIIDDAISDTLKEIFNKNSPNYNMHLISWDNHLSYIKIIFKAQPNTELTKFINAYKSAGSRLIKKDYSAVKDEMVNGQFWSKSFCLLTIGEINEEVIRSYLKKQGNDIEGSKNYKNFEKF